jgi:hypothetical protein
MVGSSVQKARPAAQNIAILLDNVDPNIADRSWDWSRCSGWEIRTAFPAMPISRPVISVSGEAPDWQVICNTRRLEEPCHVRPSAWNKSAASERIFMKFDI